MRVVVVNQRRLDLGESLLNEDGPVVSGEESVVGAALFDENECIVPLVSEFLTNAAKDHSLAFQSVVTYGRNIGYFLTHIRRQGAYQHLSHDEALLTVNRLTIAQYLEHLRNVEGLDSTTIRNRDACLRTYISGFLCVAQNDSPPLRTTDPYSLGFISPKPKRRLVNPCSLSDLKVLMLRSRYERERLLLQFIFDSGVRRSEVGRVTAGAINTALAFATSNFICDGNEMPIKPEYCPLYIHGSKGSGNEEKPRWALVSRITLERVKKYMASPLYRKYARGYVHGEAPCFFNAEGRRYTADAISQLLRRLSEKAVAKRLISKSISPHKLRHGNAYAILNSPDLGSDFVERLVITQKSLGHARTETTEVYTQVPHDLYKVLSAETGEVITRATFMAELYSQTKLKIDLAAKK
ncbi:tyrosine-type recombinase/integrase [Pseudomonas sp. 8 R 14]|uniref:tyrosine-type recombinase/integrase n=1 Tax=Pseudomonas sp. 8 R 14 TaxID=1844092 RepID=UPI0008122763|nr:tyrosine-type recombinase/integrase [Pseudomonas sp. 8 R 14]CRM27714.1 Tyrosine recombinase XerC [Pseudomonas sp. 8 R 14]